MPWAGSLTRSASGRLHGLAALKGPQNRATLHSAAVSTEGARFKHESTSDISLSCSENGEFVPETLPRWNHWSLKIDQSPNSLFWHRAAFFNLFCLQGTLAMAGDILVVTHDLGWGMLQASSGWRLGMLFNTLQCTEWLLTTKNYGAQMSILLW